MRTLFLYIVAPLFLMQMVLARCFSCSKPDGSDCIRVAQSLESNSPDGTIYVNGRQDYFVGQRGGCYVYAQNLDFAGRSIVRRSIAQAIRSSLEQCTVGNQCGAVNVGYFEVRFDSS